MSRRSFESLIAEGQSALARGDAPTARQVFEAALAEERSGEVFEGLARALHIGGEYPGSIEAHEHAFAAYRDESDVLGAARAARLLAWLQLNVYGDWAVAAGWLARAGRVLDEAGDAGVEAGWVELVRATGEPYSESRERRLEAALESGRRYGEADLEFAALALLGETLVMRGRVEEGMLSFDEALAAVCAGEVEDLYVVEAVFCGMLLSCERVQDVARAEQWLRAADELVERRGLVAVGPLCRAHYGGILLAAGRWDEAETALDEAARMFAGGYAAARAIVLVRLADLRVRQGRFEEAEVLLEGLDQIPDAARPLAALRLERGETALARELLERRLAAPAFAAPWPVATTDPLPPPVAAPLLALLVDVHLAEGAAEEASSAAGRLAELAERHPSAYLQACAALAKGKVCLQARARDARACLRDALAAFSLAQMPVELARAHVELARAVAEAQPEVAVAEAREALAAFERRQAARDADAAAALLRSLGASGRSGPKRREPLTKREAEVLELLGHGLSNAEIAQRLVVSRKTAEHHVRHVLAKLGLRNRAEAAAYATRLRAERSAAE